MDYKVFIQELDNIKKSFADFISNCNKKNLSRADKLVNDYVSSILEGNYSIKSYKAKIIHNELEHSRTRRELRPLKEKTLNNINELIDNYFMEYLDELDNQNIFATKGKDMREFIQTNRRQKHDVLLKRNNTEKEFNIKTKEYETNKNDLISNYNEKISDLKFKLSNNLKKSNDKTIKQFQEFETKLLDCDDYLEIKKIKENIKNIRLVGLDEEFNFKIDTYQTILEEELNYNINYFNFITQYEDYNRETQNKLADYEKINNELNFENEFKDKSYEFELKKYKLDLLLKELEKFVKLVNLHNQKIISNYSNEEITTEDKLVLFDIIESNYYRLLLAIYKNNLYDPLIYILSYIIESVNNIKEALKDVYYKISNNSLDNKEKLINSLESYVPVSKKKTSKEELVNNVISSLDRYYNNFITELDSFNKIIFEFYFEILSKLMDDYNKCKASTHIDKFAEGVFIKETNYHFVDLNEYGYSKLSNNYKFKDLNLNQQANNFEEIEEIEINLDISELKIDDNFENELEEKLDVVSKEDELIQTLEDNLLNLENEIRVYYNFECLKIDEKIKELENIKNKEVANAEKVCKEKHLESDKKYKQLFEAMNLEKIQKDKEIKKLTSKYINNARKLLNESKAML